MKAKKVLSAKQFISLIEIIIALVFFAVAAVIILRLFSEAHNTSRLAHDINNATLFVTECAEKLRVSDFDTFPDILDNEGFTDVRNDNSDYTYHAYLDENFIPTQKSSEYSTTTLSITVRETEAGILLTGRLVCIRKDLVELIGIDVAAFYRHNIY